MRNKREKEAKAKAAQGRDEGGHRAAQLSKGHAKSISEKDAIATIKEPF